MMCMLITILVVLAHESNGVRHIVLENGLVVESENFSEVLVAENDSASLRPTINDESKCAMRLSAEQEEAWIRKAKKVLAKARKAPEHSGSSEFRAFKYIKRFLLKNLCEEKQVKKILLNEKRMQGITDFLNDYIAWAKERKWNILHEFSVEENADVVVVGDLHGHFAAMRAAFRVWLGRVATKPTTRLVFLGDFVDRGKRDVETAIAIMALQMWMNGPVVVLRGNHENDRSRYREGWTFAWSLSSTFDETLLADGTLEENSPVMGLWDKFFEAFWNLPAAAIMTLGSQRYFMLHGGWTKRVLDTISLLKKTPLSTLTRLELGQWPPENSTERLIEDLVWSDVEHKSIKKKYGQSSRGPGIATYGYEAIEDMFKALKVDWCISGHKHENREWRSEKSPGKGHFVVVSADVYCNRLPAKVVVIETKNPPGRVCCCWKDKINKKSRKTCKHHFTQKRKWCCKSKAASSCTTSLAKKIGGKIGLKYNKYRMSDHPAFCGGANPSFVELSPLIPTYTFYHDITEGIW